MQARLQDIYARLYAHFGPQHWWPQSDGAFEIILGAILTQNTAWTNVEQALANLRRAELLTPARLHRSRGSRIERLIRPSGFFRLKTIKLQAFTRFLFEKHRGRLKHLFALDAETMREELLTVYGIGPETADSIVLYAAHKPIFVIDAYTRRICSRLGLAKEGAPYDELQQIFMTHLPQSAKMFNQYHALFVALGKYMCRKRAPKCSVCPLKAVCPSSDKLRNADLRR